MTVLGLAYAARLLQRTSCSSRQAPACSAVPGQEADHHPGLSCQQVCSLHTMYNMEQLTAASGLGQQQKQRGAKPAKDQLTALA